MLSIGDTAPNFTLPSDLGHSTTLSDLQGHEVVLFFYPKDDTSGCTKEAIAFSELLPEFTKLGVKVFGISRDPLSKHEKFRAKHELTVDLLSDEAGEVTEAYGVWVEKSMYGKKYMGIERSTFFIDSSGVLRQIWRKVKVPGHAEAVLDTVKASKS